MVRGKKKKGANMNTVLVSFDESVEVNMDLIYNHLKKIYPAVQSVKPAKNGNEFHDLFLASESSLGFWENDIDDEVWGNA